MRLLVFLLMALVSPVLASDKVKVDIVKVTDGDTVKALIEGEKVNIRLLHIDCYETSDNPRAYWQAEYYKKSLGEVIKQGKQSKEILQQLINKNKDNVYLLAKGKDKYKRTLGELYIGNNEQSINDYMLEAGKCEKYKARTKKKR